MHHMMFANGRLERRFSKLVDSAHEIGGFLVYTMAPLPGLHRNRIKSAYGLGRYPSIAYITSWIVVPNEAKSPQVSWGTSIPMTTLNTLAADTAYSQDEQSHYIHFHTHPTGGSSPSPRDINFWFSDCCYGNGKHEKWASGVIITRWFTWGIYDLCLNKAKNTYTHHRFLRFISWQSQALLGVVDWGNL